MIVDSLAREVHAAGEACGGIGLEEGGQDAHPKGVIEEDGSLGGLAEEVDGREGCAHERESSIDQLFCQDNLYGLKKKSDRPTAVACPWGRARVVGPTLIPRGWGTHRG
jgi:hypothetical protein